MEAGASLPPGVEGYIVCQYCGSNLIWNRQDLPVSEPQELVALRGMRLKQFSYTDRQGTGLELFNILIPSGWQFEGGCRWLLNNPGMPAEVAFQVYNPHGAEMFSALPNIILTSKTSRSLPE